jgi:hypothetical protein
MCSEAILTLSLVIRFSEPCGAFPNAKLIRCSCNSSSVTGTFRDASNILVNSGSGSIVLKNCCRSAMGSTSGTLIIYAFSSLSIASFFHSRPQLVNTFYAASSVTLRVWNSPGWLLALTGRSPTAFLNYTLSSTTVAPPPPSFCEGSATDSTCGCCCSAWRSALRRIPMPLP